MNVFSYFGSYGYLWTMYNAATMYMESSVVDLSRQIGWKKGLSSPFLIRGFHYRPHDTLLDAPKMVNRIDKY